MEPTLGDRHVETALSVLAQTVADALHDFASSVAVGAGSTRAIDDSEEELGVRQRQIVQLDALAGSDGLRVAEIADAIDYDTANTHLTLRALERRGLVERVPGKTPQHWRLSNSARKRRRVWEEPELIVALDLYLRDGVQPPQEDLERTKSVLDRWALANGYRPRPMGGLVFKLGNLHSIATNGREGFAHGGASDLEVWNLYASDTAALADALTELKGQLGHYAAE
jgi:hypothetical protein